MPAATPHIEIRPAAEADLPRLREILRDGWRRVYGPYVPEGYLQSRRYGAWTPPAGGCLVAVRGGRVAGFAAFGGAAGDAAELSSLYVDADARGEGVGSRLLGRACAQLADRGCVEVRLRVLDRNLAAQGFYARRGFEPAGEAVPFSMGGTSLTAIVLRKRLSPGKRVLMWACAVMPDAFRRAVAGACREANREVGLPEGALALPLHVSLKQSFRTTDFEGCRDVVLAAARGAGPLDCRIGRPQLRHGMVWLPVDAGGGLGELHARLDRALLYSHGIEPADNDERFEPHVSLFTEGPADKMREVLPLLERLEYDPVQRAELLVVGSSAHGDGWHSLRG